ncbi:MAG: S1 RNA-binding domain-containing protein [Leptolyngbya sp. SIO1E4]|nr:S1 RNA-binding domain-containing protein [Leptolyngbya sp. SIO1E4]
MTFSTEDFARALADHDYTFQTGSTVRGTVIGHGSEGAFIEIGGKSDAFLPLKEAALGRIENLEERLPLGEVYEFLIIRDQDSEGRVVLSIRRLLVQQLWEKLTQQQADSEFLDVKVTGTNKGGVIVDVEGLRGFVPRSQLSQSEDLEALVGSTLSVSFLEVNPEKNKLVLSQKAAARSQAMGRLGLGQLVSGTIASLKPYGAFVNFDGVTGLLHINQISKNYVDSLPALLQVGQAIKAIVVNLDEARNRISLSTKVLEKYPGEVLKEFDTVMADAENRIQDVGKLLAESDS